MSLYEQMKEQLLKQIMNGEYAQGKLLPTESELCEIYDLSRVTVRRALDELKREGIITSVKGQGTKVAERNSGHAGTMDIITLVAQVHNPFFSSFMAELEQVAERHGSLVLFKQDFQGDALSSNDFYFLLHQRNIRNLVFWPSTAQPDVDLMRRLRAVGNNMVFFDQKMKTAAADVVCLNQQHAVETLYDNMRGHYKGDILFIGYEEFTMPNESLREEAFIAKSGRADLIFRIPWGGDTDQAVSKLIERLLQEGVLPAGIIGCNGPIGLAAVKKLRSMNLSSLPLATIDYLPEMEKFNLTVYRQPMRRLAEATYQRLHRQNTSGDDWHAEVIELEGERIQFFEPTSVSY